MTDDMDRRKFLRAVPAAVALTAGCGAAPSETDTPGETAAESTDETPTTAPESPTATPTSTPADESPATYTPTEATIGTEVVGDVLANHPRRARVIREFMPQAGPASIAVAFPRESTDTEQSLCFDAGACELQYAWSGGFIQIPYVKDDGPASIDGQPYYRPDRGFPLRFDEAGTEPSDLTFQGYSLADRLPEFRYVADGVSVRQHLRPAESGQGFTQRFRLPERTDPVRFVTDPDAGVAYESDAGSWEEDALVIDGDDAVEFTVGVRPE